MKKIKQLEPTFYTEKIGEVEIDTGTLVIVDPCRIDELDLSADLLAKGSQICGEPYKDGRQRKTAVISSTGLGDGRYPVFARIVKHPDLGERVVELMIRMDFDYCFADDPKVKKEIAKREKEFLKWENA